MDRNQLTGWILIGAILIGFFLWNKSDAEALVEEAQKQEAVQDSINAANNVVADSNKVVEVKQDTTISDSALTAKNNQKLEGEFGIFAPAALGKQEITVLENEKLKIFVNNKGGYINKVQVKGYSDYEHFTKGDTNDLTLFEGDSAFYQISFRHGNKLLNTKDFYFSSDLTETEDAKTLSSKLTASNGGYIQFNYTLKKGSYLLDFDVNVVGLERDIEGQDGGLNFLWEQYAPTLEKSIKLERQTASIFYYSDEDGRDYLNERSENEQEVLAMPLKWVSFKQQFFSSIFISKDNGINGATLNTSYTETDSSYVKYFKAKFPLKYESSKENHNQYNLYFGPNDYDVLAGIEGDLNLEDELNLGWGIFRIVNKYFIYPIFQFFIGLGLSGGIAIILLTFAIKLVLFPITYKNYLSSAKMRVIKPRLEKINEENKDADPMKKQQAVMQLYKQTGVNPLAGCIPALLQMPILYALFRLFPVAIELRHEGFLWADDLSSVDNWIPLPFTVPLGFGNHLSLFTLLMSISMFFYMRFNQQMTPTAGATGGGNDMQAAIQKNMKVMMNFMPVMMLFFFNNYATGLSLYYLLANMITIAQTLIIKKYIINESAILEKIETNMKAPMKKSRWQKKMEEIQKKQAGK